MDRITKIGLTFGMLLLLIGCSSTKLAENSDDAVNRSQEASILAATTSHTAMNGFGDTQLQPYKLEIKTALINIKNGPHLPLSNATLAKILTHEITVSLNQTHRFDILFTPSETELTTPAVNNTLPDSAQDDTNSVEATVKPVFVGADYYLLTTLIELNTEQTVRILKATGQGVNEKVVSTAVLYQLVDAKKQQIVLSNTIQYQLKSTMNNETLSSAITHAFAKVADLIKQQITHAIYPVRVLSVDEKRIILDQPLAIGTKCAITQLGQKIHDSYSNSVLGNDQTVIGQLIITEQTNVIAYGELLDGRVEKGNICKMLPNDSIKGVPELIKRTEQGGVVLPFD